MGSIMEKENFDCLFIPAIPFEWIEKIQAPIGGAAFRVALYIWFKKGVKKTTANLIISSSGINGFYKMDKRTFSRALHELEDLKMITVERSPGRSPKVSILDFEK
jgi:hypothetical protein